MYIDDSPVKILLTTKIVHKTHYQNNMVKLNH